MNYTTLPNTALKVSNICLGTMTFGEQNTESEAHDQINFSLEKGINFIDTAEMYSVPAQSITYGKTEEIIGNWFKKSGKRDQVILATKIAGANRNLGYIRDDMRFTDDTIRLSVEKSLKRLQTDYIDLYQLHWPERKTNMFGQLGYVIQEDIWTDNIHQTLCTIQNLIQEGKINHFGVSNETPWGLMRFLDESKKHNLPKPITIQNPYSLLNRTLEIGLAEICYRENVGVLSYSPLAFGVLSGKFLNNEPHPTSRLQLFPQFIRYNSEQCQKATSLYNEIAKQSGLTLVQMALAFIKQQQIVSSTIIGATTLQQLQENIATFNVELSKEVVLEINKIQKLFPNPAP